MIILYGIYFIKNYFYSIIQANFFIISQLRQAPTTVTSTSPVLEVAATIKQDPNGWTNAMNGSDALVRDEVKSVSITGTELTPCVKRRCYWKKRAGAVNAPQDAIDGTAMTEKSAVDGKTSLLVEMADLDSEELDWSLPSLVAEQLEDLKLKHICAMIAASTKRPSTEETLLQSAAVKLYVQQWELLVMRSGLLHRVGS